MSRRPPQMHPLLEAIRRIEGWEPPAPRDNQWLTTGFSSDSMEFVRMAGVPVGSTSRTSFFGMQQWLHGMWAGGKAAGAFVVGRPGRIEVFVGSPSPARAWSSRLCAAFPGCSIEDPGEVASRRASEAVALPYRAAVAGHPGQVGEDEPASVLDELVVAAGAGRWAWMVFASPRDPGWIQSYLADLGAEAQETVSAYLRKGSAEDGNNPGAQRYLELLHAARSRGELGMSEGLWEVRTMLAAESRQLLEIAAQSVQAQLGRGGLPEPIRIRSIGDAGNHPQQVDTRCSSLVSTSELAILLAPPTRESAGYRIRSMVEFDEDPPHLTDDQRSLSSGVILSRGHATGNWLDVSLDDIASHLLIAGSTGSGKTRTMQFLLRQLWEDHRIPWLVVEPSLKSEYRCLLSSLSGVDLRILTPGKEAVAPMRLNPLEIPPGVLPQTHLDALLALFKAAFSWVTPMPYVLEQALYRVYEHAGWDLTGADPRRGSTPSLPALADAIEAVTVACGWDAEITANIRAGLLARLRGLTLGAKGRLFNTSSPLDLEAMLSRPTIIELAAIGNDDEKAFLVGLIALRIAEHRQAEGRLHGSLRHLLVLEEAHRLLRSGGQSRSMESSDPTGHAVETLAHMLAEVRAFGQGIAAVEQIPSKVLPDVVKNTAVKIIHRLAGEDDRHLVGGAAGLGAERREALSTLDKGEAIVALAAAGGTYRVRIPDHTRSGQGDATPTDAEVAGAMTDRFPPSEAITDVSRTGGPSGTFGPNPFLRPVQGCLGCSSRGCRWTMLFHTIFNRQGLLERFESAVHGGWNGLFRFARTEIGSTLPAAELDAAAVGLLMHLACVLGWSEESRSKLLRNLQGLTGVTGQDKAPGGSP